MICAAVTYVIKPGHEEEAAELFRTLTEHTRAEPGCRMYLAHCSTTDPRRFFLYEQYADQAALDAHRAAPHFERYVKEGLFPITESRTPSLRAADRLSRVARECVGEVSAGALRTHHENDIEEKLAQTISPPVRQGLSRYTRPQASGIATGLSAQATTTRFRPESLAL